MSETLLTAREAKTMLAVSTATFWRIVYKYNQLPVAMYATFGTRKRPMFAANDVEKVLAQRNPNFSN